VVDIEKAVARNRQFMSHLGWTEHRARIVEVMQRGNPSDEREFAECVAEWQAGRGVDTDGIVGPITWGVMASLLGFGVRYGAWRPGATEQENRMQRHDIVCLHTMDGTVESSERRFRKTDTEAHFGVGHDGKVYQWQDTRLEAHANKEGNRRLISIETEDRGPGFAAWTGGDVPAWTNPQVDAIAHVIARCFLEYDIPITPIPDTRPQRRGVGYHRQGIGSAIVSGGENWSKHKAKACPGNRRIAQIPSVLKRAQDITGILIRFQPRMGSK
jgi:hypothetical protein